MTTKSTISIVALVAALMSANAFAVRVANPRVVNGLKAFYQEMADAGGLDELSENTKQICNCLEEGSEHDKVALVQAAKEARSHGFLIRPHIPSSTGLVNRNVQK